MNRFLQLLATAGLTVLAANAGTVTSITLYENASPNVVGNDSTYAPGFQSSSWQANGTPTDGDLKQEVYIAASSLFTDPVTFADIASVSYWTNKPGASTDPDWSFYIYTAPGSGTGEDTGGFYHSRLTAEPLYTGTASADAPPGDWHQWSTDGTVPLRFYDSRRDANVQGTGSDPTLTKLQEGDFTWPASSTTYNYNTDVVSAFSLQTGTAWANGFTGLLDGLTVTLKNGDVGTVNFESTSAVPEPGTVSMMLLGGAALLAAYRRRK